MKRYIALIHKSPGSIFGAMFPDFPGCVSAGETMEKAAAEAREALAFHAETMQRDGDALPAPRTLDEIRAAGDDWIEWEGAVAALIPLLPPRGDAVRVNINIDRNLLAAVDAVAEKAGQSRSAFVARALETSLEG